MTKAVAAQEVKTRPIIFGADSIRAILEGRKTQTRRVIQPQPRPTHYKPCQGCKEDGTVVWHFFNEYLSADTDARMCPYGKRRERLWVREAHAFVADEFGLSSGVAFRDDWIEWLSDDALLDGQTVYNASNPDAWKWRSPIFMPRWASRITLELTDVRVERLDEIDEADAIAEGVDVVGELLTKRERADERINQYCWAWDELNAKRGFGWDVNPWVWVLSFKKVEDAAAEQP